MFEFAVNKCIYLCTYDLIKTGKKLFYNELLWVNESEFYIKSRINSSQSIKIKCDNVKHVC